MSIRLNVLVCLLLLAATASTAQDRDSSADSRNELDSIYISEVEDKKFPAKVLHAEPLYIDLIRDLGARKGEREWNVGLGLTDNTQFDTYTALVEYEWAPINRMGLEVELPFSFYYPTANSAASPKSKLNSIKLAGQYSFYISEKRQTSMAVGYIHEFELTDFTSYGRKQWYNGNVYNPFFIAARRWGQNFHTLLYTGPRFTNHFSDGWQPTTWQINSNFHYMIDGTRNFVGVEINKELIGNRLDVVMRPQIRVGVADNLLVGIVTGIPIKKEKERLSTFLRLIYEPGHKAKH